MKLQSMKIAVNINNTKFSVISFIPNYVTGNKEIRIMGEKTHSFLGSRI